MRLVSRYHIGESLLPPIHYFLQYIGLLDRFAEYGGPVSSTDHMGMEKAFVSRYGSRAGDSQHFMSRCGQVQQFDPANRNTRRVSPLIRRPLPHSFASYKRHGFISLGFGSTLCVLTANRSVSFDTLDDIPYSLLIRSVLG